jgi:hypothetical protein
VEAKYHMKSIATALGNIVENILSASTHINWK